MYNKCLKNTYGQNGRFWLKVIGMVNKKKYKWIDYCVKTIIKYEFNLLSEQFLQLCIF